MFWRGKRIFLTGHTGFKGSWLSLWLQTLGAEVTGFALAPPTSPSLFEAASTAEGMRSATGDISDLPHLKQAMQASEAEIVIHMAAQSLVRVSYQDPILTYQTNAMGTAHVLEAVRETPSVAAVLVITSDKCYENQNWLRGYREGDTLGGHDPYSNSKACAELIVSAYRSSFFNAAKAGKRPVAVASARAGNVIGGGDWAQDRLVPDMVKAFTEQRPVKIRNPQAVRPWQFVLDPLRGYLLLAQKLYEEGTAFAGAWNFGPYADDAQPVCEVVESFASAWRSPVSWELDAGEHPHETQMLQLDWSKASHYLGWYPVLRLPEALSMTADWYQHFLSGGSAREKCLEQISKYCSKLDGEANVNFVAEKNATSSGQLI
jgi:CDP-glucose 4,6-dehydratase